MRFRRALLLAGLACLTLAGCEAAGGPATARKAPVPVRPAAAGPPLVMFLGDSYTVGERGALPENTYASATARLLGWQVVVGGRGGTGFVATGLRGQTFGAMFESQLGWRPAPDLLVVSGGHNDARYPAARAGAGARELLGRAGQRWPGTRQVLIGPLWGNERPSAAVLAVRDALRGVAGELRVPFVDPIAERWITGDHRDGTGNARRYIKPDGVHPTVPGHRYLASRLAQDLRRLGLAHPLRTR
ncbi:SGNH/GDSL hydrolase family protein [Actinomadura macrotermitis]|uniref:SGNH hydrolase-type esterase domain-containing protein n=1 Tax=Actinomadura macrotermitis TaxID=2585200 RepID=A0A7K0BQ03_9ACTN|nr:SGNH/GDSL hydrolase family protein [Actinomadura macrotermitis]MQY03268.1 hypothetical protein [Actinomadura macrotermitis]